MLLPLLLLIFSAILSVSLIVGNVGWGGSPLSSGWFGNSSVAGQVNGSQSLNGSSSTLSGESFSSGVSVTMGVGVLALLVTSVAFAGIMGIRVLGSGLAEFSVMAIFRFASCYGMWLIFSVPALALFLTVPWFGLPLYFLLTFFYSFGVLETLRMGA